MRTVAGFSKMMGFISPRCYLCRLGKAVLPSTWRHCYRHWRRRRTEFAICSMSLLDKSVERLSSGIRNNLKKSDHIYNPKRNSHITVYWIYSGLVQKLITSYRVVAGQRKL